MKKQTLYRNLAEIYDLIYEKKNYQNEVDKILKIINKYKETKGRELLDVACGTGKHLRYLKNKFNCTGLDINQGILKIAKDNIKGVKFQKADMISFNLEKKFDIITCLFSAIGYLKSDQNLKKTIQNFGRHLKVGGVIIIEPWFSKEKYKIGTPHLSIYDGKDIKIARVSVSKLKRNLTIIDMNYLIAERGKEVKYYVDRHELLLTNKKKFLRYMKEANFKAKFLSKGLILHRGVFIGIKK